MKKLLTLLAIALLCATSLVSCADKSIGIIGGADGPTAIIVGSSK